MNYSNDPNQVVFLKDSDIVQDIAGKNKSGNSVEWNGIASYSLVSAISNDTSVAIDSLMSDILSVNDLISNGTTGINTQIKFLSDTIQEPISSTISSIELSVQNNNTDIETIKKDIKGGIVYQGHLKLDYQTNVYALSDYVAFLYDNNEYPHASATLTKPLSNGWMYYVDFNPADTAHAGITDVGSFETNETDEDNPHITFVPGNYIIVHTHNEDDCVILSDLGRNQIDIIQVTDSDLVRFKNLNDVSAALCGSTIALVSSISNTLSDAINTHIEDYSQLCTDLSTAIATVTNDVNTTISNAIDKKVRLSSYGNPDIQNIDTLIINRLPVTQYKTLVDNENVADDQIYVVEDDNYSLFGRSISDVNDIQATSGHIDNVSAGSLTVANEIQAAGLNVAGTGNVNVANVNASQQISVENDAFYAKQNGEVSAKNLSLTTLSVNDSFTLKNGNYDGISAKSTSVGAGLTADGMISANQLFAKTEIVLNGKLTADTNKTTAVALSTPALTADSTSAGSIAANSIAVNSETASNLTATSLSSQTLTVANSIQLFNDSYGISKDGSDNALNIRTSNGSQNEPNLKINGKLFKDYYATYLSAEYLSDGYIDSVSVGISAIDGRSVAGLQFTWKGIDGKTPTFIPLSSLGGIYEGDGSIISIDKSDPNEFKINASPEAISNAINTALSNAFGIQDIKDELSNKIKFKNGENVSTLTSLTIRKTTAAAYSALEPADKNANDVIYVIDDNDMNMFGSKITNLGTPETSSDAATKDYVDVMTAGAKSYSDTEIATASTATLNSAKDYTDTVSGELNTALVDAIGTAKTNAITSANAYTDTVSGALNDDITAINDKVDNKIQFKEGDSSAENIQTLTIRKMTAAAYNDLTEVQKRLSNVIYSIEDSNYNMFGNRIVQLGAPSANTDAATKKYVDDQATATKSAISSNLSFSIDSNSSNIVLNVDGAPAASFSYSNFVKDSVLSAVQVSAGPGSISTLVFKFKTEDTIQPIAIDLTSFAALYEGGNYISLSAKAGNENIQTVNVNYDSLSSDLADDITAVVKTALVGTNDGSDWGNVDSNAGLGILSTAIKSNIKSSIEANDLSALYKNINGTGTAGAPDNGTSFYALSAGIKSELVGNNNNDWNNIDSNAGLGILSSSIFNTVASKLTANHNTLNTLDGSNWLHWLTRNSSQFGTWTSPADNSPLHQFAKGLSVGYATRTEVSSYCLKTELTDYCLKSELSIDTANVLSIDTWDGASPDLTTKINQIIATVNAIHSKLADLTATT